MPLTVTPLYLAATAVLMAVLSTRVALLRGTHNVALGDGGVPNLFLAQRRFGNLAEYAAMALLLLAVMELQGVPAQWLHVYGASFVALRVAHPLALFLQMDAPIWQKALRFLSAAGTALLLVIGAVAILAA
ncbi:MAG: MAPEG family protein [Pseudomonadota bacterium]